MTLRPVNSVLLVSVLIAIGLSTAHASLIYLYDFPSGSGLAADQTNSQPTGSTFSDFVRNNVDAAPNPGDTFGSKNWSQSASLDPSVYESFSIAADVGFHLNLSNFTFQLNRSATGPANMEVALFLNGAAAAYATYDFAPTTTLTAYAFNFTPLTDADNVTSATIKFFGWNAGGVGGQLYLDNVATYGDVSAAPEMPTLFPVIFVMVSVLAERLRSSRHPRSRPS
jgi:hypothetical protein